LLWKLHAVPLIHRCLLLFALLALTSCEDPETSPGPLPEPGEGTWGLVFHDEFEGEADNLPNASVWAFDVSGAGFGNQQLEYDTDRPENVSLDGLGHLRIVARAEKYLSNQYTSGRIQTRDTFTHAYGRFEARMKMPVGRGLWPAFWLLGADEGATTTWPESGELDVVEYLGQEPLVVHGSAHGPGYSGANPITATYELPGPDGFDDAFHVFAIEWDEARIAWLVDGQVYQVMTPDDLPAGTEWVFDHPFFLILNLAVGGNFPGPPDASTVFPQTLLVDYVRVYERIR
jgi:beta-glucanase (GH16 family)